MTRRTLSIVTLTFFTRFFVPVESYFTRALVAAVKIRACSIWMTASINGALVDICTKTPLKTSMTLTTIVSSGILTVRFGWANSPIGTFVNIQTTRNLFQRLPVTNDGTFIPVPAAANVASYCIGTVQLSLARFLILLTLVNIYTVRLDPCKAYFTSTPFQ